MDRAPSRALGVARVSRFCLRYQAIDVSLGASELVAGRAPECGLVLDDALVSRRHAAFRELGDEVEVEDLGSRNGVLVNDVKIAGKARLRHGDRVQIGSHQLVVKDVMHVRPQAGTAELARCPSCGQFGSADADRCESCGAALPDRHASGAASGAAQVAPAKAGNSLSMLARLADKALSMGRADEAERVLASVLSQVLQAEKLSPATSSRETLEDAAGRALRLAEALQKTSWIDYALELYSAAAQLMPAALIDDLYRVTSKVHYGSPPALQRYLGQMRVAAGNAGTWGPTERFLLQRLEGLARRLSSG